MLECSHQPTALIYCIEMTLLKYCIFYTYVYSGARKSQLLYILMILQYYRQSSCNNDCLQGLYYSIIRIYSSYFLAPP